MIVQFAFLILSLLTFVFASNKLVPLTDLWFHRLGWFIIIIHIGLIIDKVREAIILFRSKSVFRIPYSENQDFNIAIYMKKLISSNGRTYIWSRDLSWAKKFPEVKDMLLTKAINDEIELFVPFQTDLTKELESNGAKVFCYGHTGHSIPNSRFTYFKIANKGDRVAIGVKDTNKNHIIKEIYASDEPTFSALEDLLEIVRRISK